MKEKSAHSRHFILMDDLALRSPGLTQQLDLSHSFLPGSSLTAPVQAPVLFARIVAIASQPSQPVHEPDEHMMSALSLLAPRQAVLRYLLHEASTGPLAAQPLFLPFATSPFHRPASQPFLARFLTSAGSVPSPVLPNLFQRQTLKSTRSTLGATPP